MPTLRSTVGATRLAQWVRKKIKTFYNLNTFLRNPQVETSFFFLGFCRRSLWLWEPVQPRVWNEHSGIKHSPVQQWAELWCLLWNQVRKWSKMVSSKLHCCHCHKLLPTKQCTPQQRRRLVQSAPAPFRPLPARLPANRSIQSRRCPSGLQKVWIIRPSRLIRSMLNSKAESYMQMQGVLSEERRHKIHNKRPFLLQFSSCNERWWRWGCSWGMDQRVENRVGSNVEELGAELAEQFISEWTEPVVQSDHRRWPDGDIQ